MPDLAKFEALVRNNFFAVCILAAADLSDFMLLDLTEDRLSEAIERELHAYDARDWTFVGVAALDTHGKPLSALNLPLDDDAIETLSQAYARHVETSIEAFYVRYFKAVQHPDRRIQ